MEHVSDFFATESLGFGDDATSIETAGPVRLTIVGFVPKTAGPIKKTIALALAAIAAASVTIGYVYVDSNNKREISALYRKMLEGMETDTYSEYQNALELAKQVFIIDPKHALTQSAAAYAALVLATEHGEKDMLQQGRDLLTAAQGASETNEWRVAAAGLLAHHQGKFEEGLVALNKVAKRSSRPLVHLEVLRNMKAAGSDPKATQKELGFLVNFAVGEARVFNYLGWHYYMAGDYTNADKHFTSALQSSRGHPQAL